MDHIPSGQYLTEKEKDKLKDAYKKGYGVTMPGEWATRLMNENDDLMVENEGLKYRIKKNDDMYQEELYRLKLKLNNVRSLIESLELISKMDSAMGFAGCPSIAREALKEYEVKE